MGDFRDQQRYDAHQEALRNSRRAKQRAAARATQRKRRVVLVALLLLPVAVAALAFTWSREQAAPAPVEAEPAKPLTSQALAATGGRVPMPDHIRGVHVTSYAVATPSLWEPIINLADPGVGMNSIQIDIKDERGEVAFTTPIPTARDSGAHMNVYDPVKTLREAHQRGLYVIGRIVTFQDGYASRANPGIAVKRKNGQLWENNLGITWLDPSNEEAWEYPLQLAAYAAELGFDEIMFDYVRYPTDGDLESVRLSDPGRNKDEAITAFLKRASRELKPRGVRVSAAFFGLAASEDLGIGQKPGKLRNSLDAFYPMIYPSHFGAGQFNIDDPDGAPGPTIAAAMADWRRRTNGGSADLRPWLQDFTMGEREYGLAEVKEQIAAAEATGAGGWLLWNARCIYTPGGVEGTAGQP